MKWGGDAYLAKPHFIKSESAIQDQLNLTLLNQETAKSYLAKSYSAGGCVRAAKWMH